MAKKGHPGYTAQSFPRMRNIVIDGGRIGRWKHPLYGLAEFDVTIPRQIIRQHKETSGETLSFTAFMVNCLAEAIHQNKQLHSIRNWRNQLIIFDNVDIAVMIEIEIEGHKFPLLHVIRSANEKSYRQIHDEIRAIQTNPNSSQSNQLRPFIRYFLYLPAFIRDIFYRFITRNPQLMKEYGGTVALSAVGMFGHGSFWGMSVPNHTTGVILGGIHQKPTLFEDRIKVHEYLNVTVGIDHDLVDGAPAARFGKQFKELVESGFGLPSNESEEPPNQNIKEVNE